MLEKFENLEIKSLHLIYGGDDCDDTCSEGTVGCPVDHTWIPGELLEDCLQ